MASGHMSLLLAVTATTLLLASSPATASLQAKHLTYGQRLQQTHDLLQQVQAGNTDIYLSDEKLRTIQNLYSIPSSHVQHAFLEAVKSLSGARVQAGGGAGAHTEVSHNGIETLGAFQVSLTSTVTENTTEFPVSENTTAVPFSDNTTAVPTSDSTAASPVSENTTVSPVSEKTTVSPSNVTTELPVSEMTLSPSEFKGPVSPLCLNHTAATVLALAERKKWAVTMIDAMGKPSSGLQEGNLIWVGSYDQCLGVRADTGFSTHPEFSGKFCFARVSVNPQAAIPGMGALGILTVGMCIPDSCSAMDFTYIINEAAYRLNYTEGIGVYCSARETTLDSKAVVAIIILSFLLALMVLGTFLDVIYIQKPKWRAQKTIVVKATSNGHVDPVNVNDHADLANGKGPTEHVLNGSGHTVPEEQLPLIAPTRKTKKVDEIGTCTKLLVAFSVYTNGAKLLSTHQPPGSLTCIHGIRFLSMTWVVLGHSFVFLQSIGENIFPFWMSAIQRWSFQAIANATVSVDSFFVMSGVLLTYLSLKEMKRNNGKMNWFLFYFHRFWRLTPAMMLVIMVDTCLSGYWAKGPVFVGNTDADACKTSWWTNLLYINNFVEMDKMCLGQTWYLANDMQFFILSPLIFVPLYFSKLWGLVSAGVFLLVTTIVPGVLAYNNRYPPGSFAGVQGPPPDETDYMTDFYMKPYVRMGAYVVGMLAGYFLYRTDRKLRINKWLNLAIWAAATAVAISVVYGLYHASQGHPVTVSVSAFYNAVNRQVWGACVAWVIVACVTGNGGFVNTLLSWSAFVPLSRLTYCIYLLHIMIMNLYTYNTRTTFYFSDINVVMFFIFVLVISYMAAAVASLAFEAPMIGLEKILLHKDKTKSDAGKRNAPNEQA